MAKLLDIQRRRGSRPVRQLFCGLAVEFQGRDDRDLAADDALHVAVEADGVFDDEENWGRC